MKQSTIDRNAAVRARWEELKREKPMNEIDRKMTQEERAEMIGREFGISENTVKQIVGNKTKYPVA